VGLGFESRDKDLEWADAPLRGCAWDRSKASKYDGKKRREGKVAREKGCRREIQRLSPNTI